MTPDERMILRADPHLLPFILPFVVAFLAWTGLFSVDDFVLHFHLLENLPDSISILLLLLFTIVRYVDRRFNRLYLTSRRLVRERGIIRKRYNSIFLEQIENLSCTNGFLGDMFDFGNLEIESVHGTILFKGIISAERHKRRIAREVKKLRIW
jgi:uncharacterized membrane protein YdbT with pleckstrin-like domain